MIDGVDFAGQMCVVALIVTADGTKVPVGLRLGDTENKTSSSPPCSPIWSTAGPRLQPTGLLVVIDGAKALAAGGAVRVRRPRAHSALPDPQAPQRQRSSPGQGLRDDVDARLRGAFADP